MFPPPPYLTLARNGQQFITGIKVGTVLIQKPFMGELALPIREPAILEGCPESKRPVKNQADYSSQVRESKG